MRNITLANDQYYHIFNRGVDKRQIFMDDLDPLRFIHGLKMFNIVNKVNTRSINRIKWSLGSAHHLYTQIISYCLMPNHFHLLLKQISDNGIPMYLGRLANGYTKYFNAKNKRSGRLFEGPYEAVEISSDAQLIHTSRYIHMNPISIVEPGWKKTGIKDTSAAMNIIESYKWSSYRSLIGLDDPLLIDKTVINEYFPSSSSYKDFVTNFIKESRQL
ncbi:MAG: transposase [Candidatus Uhrbacteria bacterium]|nr:transposase [Candidatus Uhrbacteria bacterium]